MARWPSIKLAPTEIDHAEINSRTWGNWRIDEYVGQPRGQQILTAKQVHGGNIVQAQQLQGGKAEADGICLTAAQELTVGVATADCAAVIIMSEKMALSLHVSRKTIVNGLMDNVLSYLEPKEINHIYVGPHICEYHFDFTREDNMLRRFRLRFGRAVHWHRGMIYLSLTGALQYFFKEWEIHDQKIIYDGRCTYEMLSLPSYRRWLNGGRAGEVGQLLTTVRHRNVWTSERR